MNIRVQSTVNPDHETSSLFAHEEVTKNVSSSFEYTQQKREIDTYSSLSGLFFQTPHIIGSKVVGSAFRGIHAIKNQIVKKQTADVLWIIHNRIDLFYNLSNRFPTIMMTILDDDSVLLEWNFEFFRIGISLEPNASESYYYIVSEDKEKGAFSSYTEKFGTNIFRIVTVLVDYVIRNT